MSTGMRCDMLRVKWGGIDLRLVSLFIPTANYLNGGVRKSSPLLLQKVKAAGSVDLLCLEYSKLVTTIVSTFTAHYIYLWGTYFPDTPLQPAALPSFDGRAVMYPNSRIFRDYMSWRQVDCEFCLFAVSNRRVLICCRSYQ